MKISSARLSTPLLKPRWFPRPRLVSLLERGWREGAHLCLLTAPAGYGKSTLMIEWMQTENHPFAWLSLDEQDNSAGLFLNYLLAALHKALPGFGVAWKGLLAASAAPDLEGVLTHLVEETEALKNPLFLILDDFQALKEPALLNFVDALIQNAPDMLYFGICSRNVPDLHLTKLRADGNLCELHTAQLRFTYQETAAFINRQLDSALSEQHLRIIDGRAEGWAAGLQLAILSIREESDLDAFLQSFHGSHRHVLDYLGDEVLSHQPSRVQELLLKTSILSRLNAPLCRILLKGEADLLSEADVQQMLEELEKRGLFLTRLDPEGNWFRYHALFQEFLRTSLQKVYPSQVSGLYLQAAHWLERYGEVWEALHHAFVAGDFAYSIKILETHAWEWVMNGEGAEFLKWLKQVPGDLILQHPRLGLFEAWALLFEGRFEQVEEKLAALPQPVGTDVYSREVELLYLFLLVIKNEVPADFESRLVMSPGLEPMEGVLVFSMAASYHARGQVDLAIDLLTRSIRMNEKGHNRMLLALSHFNYAQAMELKGHLIWASQLYAQLIPDAAPHVAGMIPINALALASYAAILHQQYDFEKADAAFQKALDIAWRWPGTDAYATTCLFLARFKRSQGDFEQSMRALEAAEFEILRRRPGMSMPSLAAERARLWLEMGDVQRASAWAEKFNPRDALPWLGLHYEEFCLYLRIQIARNELDTALALLEEAGNKAQSYGMGSLWVTLLLLKVRIYKLKGQTAESRRWLDEALTSVGIEPFLATFMDERPYLSDLFLDAARENPQQVLLKRLAVLLKPPLSAPVPKNVEPRPQSILSPRETMVMQLIAAGYSNKEIAARLVVEITTVKSHIKKIFEKLGVSGRYRAIARARELGLV